MHGCPVADGSLFGRLDHPVVVDLFAGGGGASLGITWALGRPPDVALNHHPLAIEMHAANHPMTTHHLASVYDVNPRQAAKGRPVWLLWASPDCTHHSRALGGKPREKGRRALAWSVVEWARETGAEILLLENVAEFLDWGPLDEHHRPIKARKGEDFRAWVLALEELGFVVEWRLLTASDYGVPTTRRRLYLVARRDRRPVVWPAPTLPHRRGEPYDPSVWAAGCIDWSDPVRSIFGRRKPLAEATQRWIAEGVRRYVLETATPFLLCLTHGGRLEPLDEPMRTTTTAHRGERALVVPSLFKAHANGFDRAGSGLWPVDKPVPTVTTTEQYAVAAATLIETRNGERAGQRPRCRSLREPAATTTAQGSQGALVAAFLAKHYGGVIGHDLHRPIGTVTARDHHAVAVGWLEKLYSSARAGVPLDEPTPTVTSGGGRGGGHAALCAAFLMRYFGSGGQLASPRHPMPTVTAREGLAVVTTTIGGEEWVLTDIGMRILRPRELARANGFPDDYKLTGSIGDQVERIGNAVCPRMAEVLVRANVGASS